MTWASGACDQAQEVVADHQHQEREPDHSPNDVAHGHGLVLLVGEEPGEDRKLAISSKRSAGSREKGSG